VVCRRDFRCSKSDVRHKIPNQIINFDVTFDVLYYSEIDKQEAALDKQEAARQRVATAWQSHDCDIAGVCLKASSQSASSQ
jgi:hypothetical protein